MRPRVSESETEAGVRDSLAGEASGNDVDPRDGPGSELPDVPHAKHVRPVLLKNSDGVRVDLALPHAAHSCALEPQVDASDAGEEGANGQHPEPFCLYPLTLPRAIGILGV